MLPELLLGLKKTEYWAMTLGQSSIAEMKRLAKGTKTRGTQKTEELEQAKVNNYLIDADIGKAKVTERLYKRDGKRACLKTDEIVRPGLSYLGQEKS